MLRRFKKNIDIVPFVVFKIRYVAVSCGKCIFEHKLIWIRLWAWSRLRIVLSCLGGGFKQEIWRLSIWLPESFPWWSLFTYNFWFNFPFADLGASACACWGWTWTTGPPHICHIGELCLVKSRLISGKVSFGLQRKRRRKATMKQKER